MLYKVEGFTFETEEEARLAGKEAEGIKYIQSRNSMDNPDTVFKLYNRLIEKEIFTTPVGIRFLGELRRYLLSVPYIRKSELLPLPVYQPKTAAGEMRNDQASHESFREQESEAGRKRDYYRPFLVSTFLAIVFGMALLGVFIITAVSSDNITILNYENQLIDRYEEWDKDLRRREDALRERERATEQAATEQTAEDHSEFTEGT